MTRSEKSADVSFKAFQKGTLEAEWRCRREFPGNTLAVDRHHSPWPHICKKIVSKEGNHEEERTPRRAPAVAAVPFSLQGAAGGDHPAVRNPSTLNATAASRSEQPLNLIISTLLLEPKLRIIKYFFSIINVRQ